MFFRSRRQAVSPAEAAPARRGAAFAWLTLVCAAVCVATIVFLAGPAERVEAGSLFPSSTALTLSSSTITISQTVTLTATVTGTPGAPIPTGTVTFYNGTTVLGTGTLNTSGVTTYTTTPDTFPSMGTYTLTAMFGGDTVYAGSTSTAQTLTVKPGGLQLTPGTLSFGNEPVGQTTAAQTVQVANLGTKTVNISQIASEEGSNPGAFSVTSNCPAALAASASCTLSITFTPSGVGAESAGVAIVDDSVPSMQAVKVSGTGTGGILQVNPGSLKIIAGDGTIGYTGDGGAATAAELTAPNGIAFDGAGNLYIADINANVVRKVDTSGNITTFAGNGTGGYAGDGGPATGAELFLPFSVQADTAGNIYIEDTGNNVIRKVNTSGVISTFAGNGTMGFAGDGGPASAAEFNQPQGARFDKSGNLYVPQCQQSAVRKIDTEGSITTVAGNGTLGYSGDGGAATSAELGCPSGVAFDAAGNFYIADDGNQVIRKVDTSGTITTIAGSTSGATGSSGDGGPAASALLNFPNDVVVDALGNLYIADSGNNRVRAINLATGVITTLAGGLNSAGSAAANTPLGLTVDDSGNVYFSNSGSGEIDEVFPQSTSPFPSTPVGTTAATQTVTLSNIGNVAIAIAGSSSFTPGGNAGDFTLAGGSCLDGTTLTAAGSGSGNTCTLQISFTPTAIGARLLTVAVADNALNSPQSFAIGGTATQGTPVVTWNMPAPITTATALSATQLDATAADSNGNPIPGTFVYSPAAGTMLPAGTQTLNVTFTPTDTTDYTTATGSTTVMVTSGSGGGSGSGSGSGSGTATTTSLAVTSGGSAVATVASGGVVTLTATVAAGGSTVTPGQVAFCDATAASCTDIHRLATRQLISTEAGAQATYTFVPGIGAHSYAAVFLGTTAYTGSISTPAALAVTGLYPTTTTVAQSGTAGSFTLTGTTVGVVPYPVKTGASSVTIDLAQSAQNYVLTGTGASTISGATYGNYYNTQGSCVTSGTTTTCDLTGDFTGSTATYASGTYDFQTVFTGSVSSAVLARSKYAVGTTEPNPFQYSGFAASTTMTLKLSVTGGGTYSIPIVASGNFATTLKGLSFALTTAVCGGTSLGTDPCEQDYVGTVAGATYSGTTTGVVEFEVPAPTPAAPTVPTGTVSFLDTSNSNAVLGTGVLGTGTAGFTLAQASGSPVTVGKGPYGMDAADLNGDGIVDLVVQNYTSGTVSVLLGNGDGTFQPQVTYAVGVLPERVLLADLNGDGKLDMVVANTGSNTIGVLLGNGDGTFQAQVTYRCGSPVGLGVMDINHDGIPDVVAGDYYANQMSVLLGNGDGTLQAAVTYATGSTPQTVAEGDFNGDGNVDVVVGNFGGATVGVFLGNGDGTFQTMVTYPVGKQPQGVQVGDFNGDGKQDLTVSNTGDGTIGVLLGNGDGTFQTQVTYAVGMEPVGIAIADFNGDGIADITVGNTGTSLTQSVLLGNGDGTFQPQVAFPTGNFPYGTTTGDFNGDGLPDIVAANYVDGTVTIFLSQPTETATASATGISVSAGTHAAVASYPGDKNFAKSVSTATDLVVTALTPVITWTPTVATIAYGTALGAAQLDATAATAGGVAIPGTFVYTPALGTVLTAGTQTLSVTFTPTDTSFAAATTTVPITVTQFAPVIMWATPAAIAAGTALSATQLDATATGVGGAALPGTFVYTPAAGTLLSAGTHTLSVAFTPTDGVDYTTATMTVPLTVSSTGCPVPGVTSSAMNIAYYTRGETDKDSSYFPINSLSSNYVLSALGTNGLPVYNPSATASSGSILAPNDLAADNEITWWSPLLNNGGPGGTSDVVATGTAVVSLPFSNNSFYPPNGAGTDDASGFQSAVLTGTLYTSAAAAVSFSISSDDAAFLYLDGQIACDDGGDHEATAVPCTTSAIAAGSHTLQVFYADLTGPVGALDFSVTTMNAVVTASQFAFGAMTLSPGATEAVGASQAITISVPVTYTGPQPTGAVGFALNGVTYPATCSATGLPIGQESCSAVVPAATIAALPAAAYPVSGNFAGDCNYAAATALPLTLTIGKAAQTITFDALAATTYGAAPITLTATASSGLPVSFAVTGPATVSGSTLTITGAGSVTVTASQAGNADYVAASPVPQSLTVGKASPVITWAAPAAISYGTALSATQLDATVAGVGGAALAGTLVYSPAAGAVLPPGTQTLSVAFTPTDAVDYAAASGTVNIVVGGLSLGGIAPLGAVAGAGNTTITLTGTGFVPTSQVSAGATMLATTYVNPTTLTAVIPASLLGETATYAVSVSDPSLETSSGAQTFTVLEPGPAANLTGPPTTQPGSQPTVGLTIKNPYPLALTAEFTLTFASGVNPPVDDQSIQFSTGGRTYSYVVAANSTSVPPVQLQAGTVAGTITITAKLMADGVDVTPGTLAPLVIVVPAVVPVISGTTVTRSGDTLTVVVHGFSNTREVSQVVFDFTAATGDTVATPMLTLPTTALFGTWFGSTESVMNYGSTFTYTQTFTTSGAASTVGPVKVTLTNSVGVSEASTGP